jgi:hypothetical protein
MKRTALSIFFVLIFFAAYIPAAYSMEVTVDIIGTEDLLSLKPGIKQSITARCIAKGIDLDSYSNLSVTVSQLGDVLSFDAILDSTPPRAFHQDLKDKSEISLAINSMIETVFIDVREIPVKGPTGATESTAIPEIPLPFLATSLTVLNESTYISDSSIIYLLDGAETTPWWNCPDKGYIFRIWAYKKSIIALVRHIDKLHTYQIVEGKTVQHWNKPVVPVADSLLSSQIIFDTDFTGDAFKWQKPETIEGDHLPVPEGIDLPSVIIRDVMPTHEGDEIISFNNLSRLVIKNGSKTRWSSDLKISPLPLFIEAESKDTPVRYYLKPRILEMNGDIITISNDRGMSKIFENIIMFDACDILIFSRQNSEFEDRVLTNVRSYYCSDIALKDSTLIALIIKKKDSYVKFIDL